MPNKEVKRQRATLTKERAHPDGRNPCPHSYLSFPLGSLVPVLQPRFPVNLLVFNRTFAFGNHNTWRAARLEHDGTGKGFGRFADGMDFFA